MLREVQEVRQVPQEPRRRWFTDEDFDLIVWQDEQAAIIAFQLTYDKTTDEHSLTWRAGEGYAHNRIDDGELEPAKYKSTPILVRDGEFDSSGIAERFQKASGRIDQGIATFVTEKIRAVPGT
jgi:hypothetical protein